MLRIAALAAEREAERQRAEKAEAEVERLREALKDMQDLCARSAACGAIARAALRQDEGEGDDC
jgi:diphthamide synthase (EF-2-diphthine--ammonia ligase)